MNVFQTTLLFICSVAAKDTEVEFGFDYTDDELYTTCPPDHNQLEKYAMPEVLVQREIETAEKPIYLDKLPSCKLQPQVSSEVAGGAGKYWKYSIGYKVYLKTIEDHNDSSRLYSSRDDHDIGEVFTLNFNTVTKKTISVEYKLGYDSRFISTASNKKRTFVYEKNEEFLEIDLDHLYRNFVDQMLPRMLEEKSKNRLAHTLGIQKVQLATPDDFVLDTWKMTAYWNINTVPIWRVLLLRWNSIEIYIRKVYKRDIDIKVQTGISGKLELVESYYESYNTVHNLHIPKYVWKLIPAVNFYHKAMLIVMHNDPFTERQEPLCVDICAINGWLVSNNDYRTGLVYCCEMTKKIAKILVESNNIKDFGIYSFAKDKNDMENLETISSILSEPQEKLYDW